MLSQASLPQKIWSFAITVFLINRLPTPTLDRQSPFEKLFNTTPNFNCLRIFDCLCYSWLKPYTKTKLDSSSKPCVFLGYLSSQSGYKCYDPYLDKFYHSRHVTFVESIFPFKSMLPSHSCATSILDEAPPTTTTSLMHIEIPSYSNSHPPPSESTPPHSSPNLILCDPLTKVPPTKTSTLSQTSTSPLTPRDAIIPMPPQRVSLATCPPVYDSTTHATSSHQLVVPPCNAPSPPSRQHAIRTRSMNLIFKPKKLSEFYATSMHTSTPDTEPCSVT